MLWGVTILQCCSQFMLVALVVCLTLFVYLPSPLFYCLGLLGVVCVLFLWALYYSLFHSLLSLLILILYIGAMIVLISYVSATSPNFLPNSRYYFSWIYFGLVILVSSVFIPVTDHYYFTSSMVFGFSDFFFLSSGLWIFGLLVSFIFIMLLIGSYLVVQKGTFRSV